MGIIRVIILVCLISITMIGQERSASKLQLSIAPPENMLLLVASQPDCPLLIEEPRLLVDLDNRGEKPQFEYKLRSISKKPIRSYTIAAWWHNQTGGTLRGKQLNKLIYLGDVIQEHGRNYTILPLSNELREKLGSKMRALVVLSVYQIKYQDGTEYNGEPLSQSMLKFFEDYFQ